MAVALGRALMIKTIPSSAISSRSLMTCSSISVSQIPLSIRSFTHLTRVRPLVAFTELRNRFSSTTLGGLKCLSTHATTYPQPNCNHSPSKETILFDGCDFEHWFIVMEKEWFKNKPRDVTINKYIDTLSKIVGSVDEARMKIYSVSTEHYFAFGALVSEELAFKIKQLPGVLWVLPDTYSSVRVREKDYGEEPFINGKAVPYDPKYHPGWNWNNSTANEIHNDRQHNRDGQNIRGMPPNVRHPVMDGSPGGNL